MCSWCLCCAGGGLKMYSFIFTKKWLSTIRKHMLFVCAINMQNEESSGAQTHFCNCPPSLFKSWFVCCTPYVINGVCGSGSSMGLQNYNNDAVSHSLHGKKDSPFWCLLYPCICFFLAWRICNLRVFISNDDVAFHCLAIYHFKVWPSNHCTTVTAWLPKKILHR